MRHLVLPIMMRAIGGAVVALILLSACGQKGDPVSTARVASPSPEPTRSPSTPVPSVEAVSSPSPTPVPTPEPCVPPDLDATRDDGPRPPSELWLSAPKVMVGDELSILGNGFEGEVDQYSTGPSEFSVRWKGNRYYVRAGKQFVTHKSIRSWSDTEIRFQVREGPGRWDVEFAEVVHHRSVVAGQIEIVKYHIPRGPAEIAPGRIAVRLAPGARPEDVRIADDRLERLSPQAGPDEPSSRWYGASVPPGRELERICGYAALREVELAEYETVTRIDD